jgi:hypothetical protein
LGEIYQEVVVPDSYAQSATSLSGGQILRQVSKEELK